MRLMYLLLAGLLIAGCVDMGERGNETNASDANGSLPIRQWVRHNASGFSFEHPISMSIQESEGTFMGTRKLDGQVIRLISVVYVNTVKAYGENKAEELGETPSTAASDLLYADMKDDPADILDQAHGLGNVSTYSISRGVYAAEVPFKLDYAYPDVAYTGYALNLFVPERSLHVKARLIAKDPSIAKEMRDNFLLSFRID